MDWEDSHLARDHMELQHRCQGLGVRQQLISCDSKHCQGLSEGRVSGGQDSERSLGGQRVHQPGSGDGGGENSVVGAAHNDIHHGGRHGGWHEDLVDDMHNSVAGLEVGGGHHGVIEHDAAIGDGDSELLAEEGLHHVAVTEVSSHDLRGNQGNRSGTGMVTRVSGWSIPVPA